MQDTPSSSASRQTAPWEDAMSDMAAEGRGTTAKLAVLSLASIREKIGDEEFKRVHKRIHIAIQSVIGKLLGSGDQIVPAGNDTYVILIRSTGYEEAEKLISHGCRSLADLFFGQDQFGNLAFKANGKEVIPSGSVVAARTFEIIASTTEKMPVAPSKAAQKAPDKPAAPAAPSDELSRWRPMQRTHATPDEISLNFIPVWDAANQVLSTYCAGYWSIGSDGQIQDGIRARADGDELKLAELDAHVIRQTTKIVRERNDNGQPLLVIVPVHVDALSTPRGKEVVIGAMRDIPADIRKLFSVQIFDVTEDMAPGILAQRIGSLCTLVRAAILTIATWTPKTAELASYPGIKAVSLTLPPAGPSCQKMLDALPDFASRTLKQKKLPAVVHLNSAQELTRAVQGGIRHLIGGAIGLPRTAPGHMVRCGISDLPHKPKQAAEAAEDRPAAQAS